MTNEMWWEMNIFAMSLRTRWMLIVKVSVHNLRLHSSSNLLKDRSGIDTCLYRLDRKTATHSVPADFVLLFIQFPAKVGQRKNAAKAPLLCDVHSQQLCPRYCEKGQEWILTWAIQRYAMHAEQCDGYSCNSNTKECLQEWMKKHRHV